MLIEQFCDEIFSMKDHRIAALGGQAVKMYARNMVEAACFRSPKSPAGAQVLGWRPHSMLKNYLIHPGAEGLVAWFDLDKQFWIADQDRQRNHRPIARERGFENIGIEPNRIVIAPTAIDLLLEWPGHPVPADAVVRRRVYPHANAPAWQTQVAGVPAEAEVTVSRKTNSWKPQFFLTLTLGNPLRARGPDGKPRHRGAIQRGDRRNVALYPRNTSEFISTASLWLYALFRQLQAQAPVQLSSERTNNFTQLASLWPKTRCGNTAIRVTLPTETGREHFAVVPGLGPITPCTEQDFPHVVSEMEAQQRLDRARRLEARR